MSLNEHGRESVDLLKSDPVAALNAYNPPGSWNMPLHKRIITRVQDEFSGPIEAASDETFLRDVHTVVKAWFDNQFVQIVDFDTFQSEMKGIAVLLSMISHLRIETLQDQCDKCHIYDLNRFLSSPTSENSPQSIPTRCCVKCMIDFLWFIMEDINLTTKSAVLVSGTKTLHHFLPSLLPPMDRTYTGEFFQGYKISEYEKAFFRKVYPQFVRLARKLVKREEFMARVGVGFNTSLTKTLDNAIIGFVIREDLAMAHAIEEGMKTPVVSKQELLDILQPNHVYRS